MTELEIYTQKVQDAKYATKQPWLAFYHEELTCENPVLKLENNSSHELGIYGEEYTMFPELVGYNTVIVTVDNEGKISGSLSEEISDDFDDHFDDEDDFFDDYDDDDDFSDSDSDFDDVDDKEANGDKEEKGNGPEATY